jgi:hypothetical protein
MVCASMTVSRTPSPSRERTEHQLFDIDPNSVTASGFMLDRCHDQTGPGDVFVSEYRGRSGERFVVLSDDGNGMYRFRDPDGVERPMRPSTMLAGVANGRHELVRASEERRAAFRAIDYMRRNDCDFLTVERSAARRWRSKPCATQDEHTS